MSSYYSIKNRKEREISEKIYEDIKKFPVEEKGDYYEYSVAKGKAIKVWKSTKNIDFVNLPEMYFEYRKMDMREDKERVESYNMESPMMCEINFRNHVIGSDETGKGEPFKPLVITAAYVENEEQLDKYISLGITDSKKIKTKIKSLGLELTNVSKWEEIREKAEKGELICGDHFATRVITNEEFNRRCNEGAENEDDIIKKAHHQVLCELYKKYPESMLVVDDFMDTPKPKKRHEGVAFKKNFADSIPEGLPEPELYLTTEGDAKVLAVGLGSVISYYISELALEYVKEKFNSSEYHVEDTVTSGDLNTCRSAEEIAKYLRDLKPEKKDEFVKKYAKMNFGSIQEAVKLNGESCAENAPLGEKKPTSAKKTKSSGKVYAVRVGKTPGIYYTWAECEAQVKGYPGAAYKSFSNEAEAKDWLA